MPILRILGIDFRQPTVASGTEVLAGHRPLTVFIRFDGTPWSAGSTAAIAAIVKWKFAWRRDIVDSIRRRNWISHREIFDKLNERQYVRMMQGRNPVSWATLEGSDGDFETESRLLRDDCFSACGACGP